MHTSLTNYIKYVRIERAKLLLTTTGLSLQEIADRLHFCSRSYFGKVFHEVVAVGISTEAIRASVCIIAPIAQS